MGLKLDAGAGEKLDEIIEALDEIGVDVYDVDHVECAEKPIGGLGTRYEADLYVQWEADDD
ncbi:hypothetical protein HCTV5_147 [Halovirus HCTV-5]|uniref:hypothetical protein n=1 Tax=Halovirus HCTV-5 TaxID=1273748 RepID=UPI0003348E8F|nr:hypothetical protein M200_gp083 [Halovirus HCTV-5]AGM11751.1 hypothetical protein HCTV5_147 [Halovirus HCTV-5]